MLHLRSDVNETEWTECQSVQMSKIKNNGLDQYGAGPFEQQQFGTYGIEGVNSYDVHYVQMHHRCGSFRSLSLEIH